MQYYKYIALYKATSYTPPKQIIWDEVGMGKFVMWIYFLIGITILSAI